ncbi:MAG: hypothetical protein PUB10_00875 [Clostridiales bacterium]|nr:hypothetical protein [Clostridiales bacterium]
MLIMMEGKPEEPFTANQEQPEKKKKEEPGELVIEDNTIYEIDRECMECLHKKRGL